MEREISFRVKRLDNGEFIEGSLTVDCHGNCCIYHPLNVPIGGGFQYFDVDKETVCQFTGMTDKNELKIFEGDIAKYYNPYSKQWYTQIVKWDKMFASFGFFTQDSEWCKENDWLKIESIEVIGNIHDNKELLK